jgi:DNA relaxase NicK
MKTSVDYWAWRSQASLAEHQRALVAAFGTSNQSVNLRDRNCGFMGFDNSAAIAVAGAEVGRLAWGGEHQRGWVYVGITGQGCSFIDDWETAQNAAFDCDTYEARRVDIALDTFDASIGFSSTLEAYRAGAFTLSSRPPKCEPTKPERPEDAAIIKIGSRESGKYFRGYERGKKVLGPRQVAEYIRNPDSVSSVDEHACDELTGRGSRSVADLLNWWRFEVELKAKKVKLPNDIIDRRDEFFAGAYPHLGALLPEVAGEVISTSRRVNFEIELAKALQSIRRQYGKVLFTARHAYAGDSQAVFDQIVGCQHAERLVQAGALMNEPVPNPAAPAEDRVASHSQADALADPISA